DRARAFGLVCPAPTRRENPYRCWAWLDPAQQQSRGPETAQILAIAQRAQSEHGVRQPMGRGLGCSAGAWMAVNLACVAPEKVSGVGALAGGPFRCAAGPEAAIQCMRGTGRNDGGAGGACAGGRAAHLRASLWQGALDPVVSPANLTALETMFGRLLGVSAGATSTHEGAVHAVYRDARGAAVLESWLVPGMGHA